MRRSFHAVGVMLTNLVSRSQCMRWAWVMLLVLSCALPLKTVADVLTVIPPPERPAGLPRKGMSMSAVQQAYGTPVSKHEPVGGSSSVRPPITRWDYVGYSVFFEHDHVIHAVAKGIPAPIRNFDGLSTATGEPLPESESPSEQPASKPATRDRYRNTGLQPRTW